MGWGGQEIRILTEARGFLDRGHRVVLYATPGSRIAAEAPGYGVPLVTLPIGRKRPAGVAALARALKAARHDVVNTHSSTDSWLAAVAMRMLRDPPVLVRTRHVSVPVPNDPGTRWLYRKATARVVTTGEALRLQLVRDNGLDPARVESIPTGIDASAYAALPQDEARRLVGLPLDVPIVGIVATLRSWKGHRHLVDSLTKVSTPHTMLAIVGDGPQREALEAQARSAGIATRFAGNQDDVAPWLQSFDLFCLPSYANEGVPQALMQAMACGLPVVTTDVGSIGEIVTEGATGVLVKPQDAGAIRAAVEALLQDEAKRRALGEAAAFRARERFGEERMVERMVAAFEAARSGSA